MTFRIAQPDDLETLNTISFASKGHWGYPSEWMERWRPDLTITPDDLATQNVLLLEHDGDIIGFSAFEEVEDCFDLNHLWVLPAYIGQGFGKKLLHETLQRFATSEKPIMVHSDPNAEKFYESQGFEMVKQVESYPEGRFLPVMRKWLNPQ